MPKRKNTKDFKHMVKKLLGTKYTVLGKYKNVRTRIKIRRNIKPKKILNVYPRTFLRNHGYHNKKHIKSRTKILNLKLKKITHNKYILLSPYVRVTRPVIIQNIVTKNKIKTTPKKIIYKYKYIHPHKITTKEFKKDVYLLVKNKYTVLGKYKNRSTKIKFRHNTKHPHTFYMSPACFLRGNRCPICFGMHKLNTKEFKKLVKHLVGNKYTVLGKYSNAMTPIKMRYNSTPPHIFYMSPFHFKHGERFRSVHNPIIASKLFKERVYKAVGHKYTILSKYVNQHIKVKIRHNVDKPHVFYMTPSDFLAGRRCPICFGNIRLTTKQFKKRVYKLVGNKFTVLGKYKNNHTPIKMRHNLKKHSHTFKVIPSLFLQCPHCTLCAKRESSSFGERAINKFLQHHNYILNKDYYYGYHMHTYKFCHRRLRADFYIPKYRTIIEFDGKQHFKPISIFDGLTGYINQKYRDMAKNAYCYYKHLLIVRIRCINDNSSAHSIHLAYKQMKHFLPLIKLNYQCHLHNINN